LLGLLGRGISPTQGTEKRGHTSMPRAGFEPTIPLGPAVTSTNAMKWKIYLR